MSYQESLQRLGDTTERSVKSVLAQYLAGEVTLEQFVEMSTAIVTLSHEQGRMIAALSMSAWEQATTGRVRVESVELSPHYAKSDRIREAFETIVNDGVIDPDNVEMRVARLAHSEAVESSQRAMNDAIEQSPTAEGWYRGLEPDACELCEYWSRGGRVWPKNHTMPTHKGCACTPVPVTVEGRIAVSEEARRASNVRRRQGTYEQRQQSGYASSEEDRRKR